MKTKFIEAAQPGGAGNWGKFLLGRLDAEEWTRKSVVAPELGSLLRQRGHSPDHVLVVDLETGEGAFFRPGGLATADLQKHRIWVCPLFEPFLSWLYTQDLTDLDKLPDKVELPAPFEQFGYRRPGPVTEERS